jgi:two-component system cell cycle sensor histidine kinase/response regulator CckA
MHPPAPPAQGEEWLNHTPAIRKESSMEKTTPRVIVVNDDPAQLRLITHVIEQEPAHVFPFCRAADALAHITQSKNVDLVVTDLHMPGIDGWRFCRLLRSADFPSTNKVPILVVSGTLSREDVGTMPHDVGADAFLPMPYGPEELLETVRSLLRHEPPMVRQSVLIVERNDDERVRIIDEFTAHGYQTIVARDSENALYLFQEHRPDVVVLGDCSLDSAGLEAIAAFRTEPHVVVVTITADQSPGLAITLSGQGADVHLAKPYDVDELFAQVAQAQQRRAMLHVESALETWAHKALHNARRIQRLNDCFLALSTDHSANIRALTQATGELLDADCVMYDHRAPPKPYTLVFHTSASETSLEDGSDRLRCLDIASDQGDQPVVVRNVREALSLDGDSQICRQGVQTYIECPVLAQERHIGSLCVGYKIDREPSSQDLNILQLLARVIARQEQLEQREQELMALNRVGRTVSSALVLDKVLTTLRHEIRDVIGAEACSIALVDPKTNELVFRQADDPLADLVVGRRLQPGQGIAGVVAQTGKSILVPDAASDPRFYAGIDEVTGLKTREIICSPLITQDKTIGVIEIMNKRGGALTMDDVRLVEAVAAQTASTLEIARLHEVTQRELAERIKTEQALQESKTRLQTFVDVTPDLIYLKDRELRYLLANRAFLDHWGLEQDDVIGKTDLDFVPQPRAQAYQQGEHQVMDRQRGLVVEEQQGDRIYELRRTPVIDESGQVSGIAGVIRDITERKQLQERLIQEQKEESILNLATGIVHDFNNALVGIVGNIDILRLDLPNVPEIEKTLHAMEVSAQRMADLTSQLLAYAGGGAQLLQRTDLNAIVQEGLEAVQISPKVVVEHVSAEELWPVRVDRNQIKQVFTNLLTNACEAMAETGGTLAIRTENVWREAWTCRSHREHPAGEYVHLAIGDTGQGMDSQVKQHLFEPFFSTKFLGRGLGLAAAQGIIRDHGGCIEIDSALGQGTTVHIYLPRHRLERGTLQGAGREANQPRTILVVEDEPAVCSLIQRALEIQGHTVVLAKDGEQALRVYDKLMDEFDAVLLDLGLPEMEGRTVLAELRARNPDIPVLLTSGYSQTMATTGIDIGGRTQFLQKPFSLEDLSAKMRSLFVVEDTP